MRALGARIRRPVRFLAAAGLLLPVLLGVAGPASAHDELLDATPRAGATIARLPGEVRLVFDDRVLPDLSEVRVTGPEGRVLSSGSPTVSGTVVTQRTAGAAPAGGYRVAYRVVSADGHPVVGTWAFRVSAGGRDGGAAPAQTAGTGGSGGSGPSGQELAALGLVLVAGLGSLVLRARVVRRAHATEPADDPQLVP